MNSSKLSVLVGLLAASTLAAAHGPTRQKVVTEQQIAAPPEQVWETMGNFQDMSWHPAIAKTEGEGGNTPGAGSVSLRERTAAAPSPGRGPSTGVTRTTIRLRS
ncbi:MAG: uncharacterized protein H6R22_410 [Chromatiaceae bacterium]|nr:uncharacterized protein [Chromatiaceae bacterium]